MTLSRSARSLPKGYMVRQRFARPVLANMEARLREQLLAGGVSAICAHDSVAIAVGSRGINGIDRVVRAIVDELRSRAAEPFIVPAMGSHGGGTAEGQLAILAQRGITEEGVGCPVRASMEVVELGRTALDTPVFLDRHAARADHIVVVNRVKPHTKLIGEVESGLIKMCMIGLGKREGARTYHRAVDHHGWMDIVRSVHEILIDRSQIRLGVALIENAYHELADLVAVPCADFLRIEPRLLDRASELMARLPFSDIELLIVDEMGKEISGTGMDTIVTGRKDQSSNRVDHLFVRDITEASHGNAQGIGLADFTTRRLVDRIDFNAVYINSQTAHRTDTCKIPMTLETDEEALAVALHMAGVEDPASYKLVWIRNTLELEEIFVSEAYRDAVDKHPDLEIAKGPLAIVFAEDGSLISPFA